MKTGLFLVLTVQIAIPTRAQTNQNAAGTEALIHEVRQLRATLERAIAIAPRVQLMMWRVGVQDQRVQRLSERLNNIQQALGNMNMERNRFGRMVQEQEERLASEKDPTVRRQLEMRVADMKRNSEGFTDREAQLRNDEAELSGQLRREQALLDDVVRQTEALAEKMASAR